MLPEVLVAVGWEGAPALLIPVRQASYRPLFSRYGNRVMKALTLVTWMATVPPAGTAAGLFSYMLGMRWSLLPAKLCTAMMSCLVLLEHCVRAAASRTFWMAGSSNPMRTAMM